VFYVISSASAVLIEKLDPLWRRIGIIVSVFAALAMGVGIADVVYTYVAVAECQSSPTAGICLWTYISAGIWGSIAVCVTLRTAKVTRHYFIVFC